LRLDTAQQHDHVVDLIIVLEGDLCR
jgi:hypothetical protein